MAGASELYIPWLPDENNNGQITYSELREMIANELGISEPDVDFQNIPKITYPELVTMIANYKGIPESEVKFTRQEAIQTYADMKDIVSEERGIPKSEFTLDVVGNYTITEPLLTSDNSGDHKIGFTSAEAENITEILVDNTEEQFMDEIVFATPAYNKVYLRPLNSTGFDLEINHNSDKPQGIQLPEGTSSITLKNNGGDVALFEFRNDTPYLLWYVKYP
jgi:hypothetical protein